MGDLLTISRGLGPRRGFLRGTRATDWYERGVELESRDPQGAAEAYRRAIAGRPDLADAQNNLGKVLHELAAGGGESAQALLAAAEGHYRLAICGRADVALYWFNLGVVLEDQSRFAEAVAAYEQALALDPMLADAHFNIARLLEKLGRRGDGDELTLRRAVRHLVTYRGIVRRMSAIR